MIPGDLDLLRSVEVLRCRKREPDPDLGVLLDWAVVAADRLPVDDTAGHGHVQHLDGPDRFPVGPPLTVDIVPHVHGDLLGRERVDPLALGLGVAAGLGLGLGREGDAVQAGRDPGQNDQGEHDGCELAHPSTSVFGKSIPLVK